METENIQTMEEKEYYLMYDVEATHWWYRALRDVIYYTITSSSNKNPKILDAGCGTGMTLKYLLSRGYTNSEGFDVSSDAIMLSKKRELMNIYTGSILEIKRANKSFDIILVIDVLGLLNKNDTKLAIDEVYRVLRPGGMLIMQCAAFEWLRSPHDDVTSLSTRYTRHEVRKLFDKNKWYIRKLSYRIFFLFPLIFLVRFFKKFKKNTGHSSKTDLHLPSPWLNDILYGIQKTENVIFRFIKFPFGSSVFVVVEKK